MAEVVVPISGEDTSGSGPELLAEVTFANLPATTINTETTTTVNNVRYISVAASGSQVVEFGGGQPARKTAGNSGVRLLIPMADLGYNPANYNRVFALVAHSAAGLGKSDSSGVVGLTTGFDISATNPFTTANWHGATDLGRWFARNNFSGSGNFIDVAGTSGTVYPTVLSASNRVFASVLFCQGFNSNVVLAPPGNADPGRPSGPYDAMFGTATSNGFRRADDDTLFSFGSESNSPYVILNFGALTQDGGTDAPTLDYFALYML